MVWQLFQSLRRHCTRLIRHPEGEEEARQDAALSVILAVQCVEVFLNVFFRVVVSEPEFLKAADRICGDLEDPRVGLDRKVKEWPEVVFGKKLELGRGPGQRFIQLKDTRHRLMHFTSSHQTFEHGGVFIHGLADTTLYENLSAETAMQALRTAEEFLCEVFKLRGIATEALPHALHAWTGRPPI
jgi:hypothetical protein